MDGMKEYNMQYNKKIESLISINEDLRNFYYYIAASASVSTCYTYLSYVSKFISKINKPVSQLNFNDFNMYLSKYNLKGSKAYSSSYRIGVYQSLKKFGDYLFVSGVLSNNPMNNIPRPQAKESQKTINKRENGYLDNTKGEIEQYINNILSDPTPDPWKSRDFAIIMIFLTTGIRASALYKLDIEDIDFINKTILVTEKEEKVVQKILPDKTINAIKKWLDKKDKIENCENKEALFISNQKKRISRHAVADIVQKYCYNIDGKKITPHKLRATYGTYLYSQVKDIYMVQECMGHASPKTTEGYIRGTKKQSELKSQEIMNRLVSGI